jgi:hypothetical protein
VDETLASSPEPLPLRGGGFLVRSSLRPHRPHANKSGVEVGTLEAVHARAELVHRDASLGDKTTKSLPVYS